MKRTERLFITPARLKKPDFWRSIQMLETLNPNADVMLPTQYEKPIKNKWHEFSPENAFMCLMYYGYGDYYWAGCPSAANKIFKIILGFDGSCDYFKKKNESRVSQLINSALCSDHLDEKILTEFIETKLSSKNRLERIRQIFMNNSLKTYQYEMIYKLFIDSDYTVHSSIEMLSHRCNIVPDYIFKELLAAAVKADSTMSNSYRHESSVMSIFKEALKRKMLVVASPEKVVVSPQQKPIEAPAVLVPEIKPEIKSIEKSRPKSNFQTVTITI